MRPKTFYLKNPNTVIVILGQKHFKGIFSLRWNYILESVYKFDFWYPSWPISTHTNSDFM